MKEIDLNLGFMMEEVILICMKIMFICWEGVKTHANVLDAGQI